MREIIEDITQYMRDHADREYTVEEVSRHFGYSKFYFSKEFKKSIGVTPNEYWAALKMENSLSELHRSVSLLNAQIKSGYQSTGTFSTNFLQATGFTPGEYKRELKELDIFNEAKTFEESGKGVMTHYSFNRHNPATRQKHVLRVTCALPAGGGGYFLRINFCRYVQEAAA
ncbi:MAG: AraC family transcriptional regulator [Clostridiales bacterium]|jgi:AraC-like DNA-binding protein|nr:AraC family transcriptional regulator [Clostridiales bacterium]